MLIFFSFPKKLYNRKIDMLKRPNKTEDSAEVVKSRNFSPNTIALSTISPFFSKPLNNHAAEIKMNINEC